MIIPACDEILSLSGEYDIIPICREIYADVVTPITPVSYTHLTLPTIRLV